MSHSAKCLVLQRAFIWLRFVHSPQRVTGGFFSWTSGFVGAGILFRLPPRHMSFSPPGQISMSQKGFTLIELMVTLAVMAILLGIAAPSFSQMLRDNRAASELNVFVSMFNFARSEAASRGLRVRVQGPLAADDSWQVVRVTTGEVMRVFPALSTFAVAPDGEKNMVFDAQGRLEGNAAVVFSVQAKSDEVSCEKYNREVTVNLAGTVTLRQEDC